MSKRFGVLNLVLALAISSIVLCAQSGDAQTLEFSPPLKAAQLMGVKVEDTDGVTIGAVRNLIVDMRSGQLRYAVIASGGFMGVRSALRLAPTQIMSAATTKREILSLNATLDQWKGAPVFRPSQLASLAQPGRAQEISRYFGISKTHVAGTPGPALSATSTGASAQQSEIPKFASDLMGRTVVNRERQKIGEIMDLLVSFGQPHPVFAILSTGKFFQRSHQYAISLAALNLTDGKRLMLNADNAALLQALPFNQQVWDTSATNSQQIFRYSNAQE